MLKITNFSAIVAEKQVLNDISLEFAPGKLYALLGHNGSGKSSLAFSLMGHPAYKITQGSLEWHGELLNDFAPEKRAKIGIFLAFQHPLEIPGVRILGFLKEAWHAKNNSSISVQDFKALLIPYLNLLELHESVLERSLHEGFSGGERKKLELLQLLVLQPNLAILDEIDSGLDVDALRILVKVIIFMRTHNPAIIIVCITHYQHVFKHMVPDQVLIFSGGRCVAVGDATLAHQVEMHGYEQFKTIF